MTIGELEAALDMPRANIRFYEQEGFIHPRRGANNYRDYTEEDADTLRKVKLLRQLGLSLEEIRQAQRGERPLAALLGEQEAALARRRAELDWAGQVCRAMREDGVEFATLDAHRYLSRLDRPADQPGFFDLRADAAPTVSHPWRRYFARGLDYSLCSFLWMVVCLFLFRWFPENNWGVRLLNAYAAYGILLAAEPLLLCTWGYTPGKWIFGLAVRNRDGGKLTWGRALSRTWGVFARGEGYGIPIYVLWRNYKCWRRCRDGEPEDWEEDTSYTMKDESGLRIGGFAAARAALFGLSLLLALQATLMPLHRGPLTPEEYAANVNDWCRRLDVCSGERMNGAGEWEEDIAPGRSAVCWPGEGGPTHRRGVGTPPMVQLCKDLREQGRQVTACLGFRSGQDVILVDELEAMGAEVRIATEDGSRGTRGFVTNILPENATYFYACGPEPMLKAVYKATAMDGELSFEERMGCGFGACITLSFL